MFDALPENEHLEVLSLTNVGLTDRLALKLAEVLEKTKTLRVLNVETNFISPPVIVTLVKTLLKAKSVEEFRASNQVCQIIILNSELHFKAPLLTRFHCICRDHKCWATKLRWK